MANFLTDRELLKNIINQNQKTHDLLLRVLNHLHVNKKASPKSDVKFEPNEKHFKHEVSFEDEVDDEVEMI